MDLARRRAMALRMSFAYLVGILGAAVAYLLFAVLVFSPLILPYAIFSSLPIYLLALAVVIVFARSIAAHLGHWTAGMMLAAVGLSFLLLPAPFQIAGVIGSLLSGVIYNWNDKQPVDGRSDQAATRREGGSGSVPPAA